ncbi:Retrovirus-related Env polyprotein from transposon gypsy [Lucilia cuprina]|nr:Retrovirus-related Env polyprotein from transposon gypsy [Lucilia cuprina]
MDGLLTAHFKLIHVIDLQKYIEMTADISSTVQKHIPPSRNKEFILHHMLQIQERLSELTNEKRRTRKSIDWIGSAWKWVAGNPDATDWNTILKSQESIIANNNEQYKINKELHQTTNQAVEKINELIVRLNNITSGKDLAFVEQSTINEIIILKDEINEIVRACQMAKSGIINTNLLDQAEINRIIDELETLPYSNAIEAVEHEMPSVYTNGSLLLYILSIPKLGENVYNLLLTRATINEGRQIDLQFNKILINAAEIYGIIDNCLSINNSTVCKGSSVTRLKEDDCLNRILRGGATKCRYRLTREEIVEVLDEDVIFVTNFKGLVESNGTTTFLNGTYLLQLSNESVVIRNHTYSSSSIMRTQALPPVFANITHDDLLLDIKYVHEISLNNINRIDQLGTKFNSSIGINVMIIGSMVVCIGWLRYQQTRKLNLPKVHFQLSTTDHQICGTQIFKEGGVNNGVGTANKIISAI